MSSRSPEPDSQGPVGRTAGTLHRLHATSPPATAITGCRHFGPVPVKKEETESIRRGLDAHIEGHLATGLPSLRAEAAQAHPNSPVIVFLSRKGQLRRRKGQL